LKYIQTVIRWECQYLLPHPPAPHSLGNPINWKRASQRKEQVNFKQLPTRWGTQ